MKFRMTKNKVIAGIAIIAILAVAFWYGGNAPGLQGWGISSSESDEKPTVQGEKDTLNEADSDEEVDGKPEEEITETEDVDEDEVEDETEEVIKDEEKETKDHSESKGMVIDPSTGKDKYKTDPVPEGKPVPVEPEDSKVTNVKGTATLSVRCDTILKNMDWLDPEKVELVPSNGVIYAKKTINFQEGESVFDVLQREMKNAKIHMEFSFTPMYNSVYIEGINNLYEFDCGELSGWMYKVNGWFPNYGASRYVVKQGDLIEWVYTCDLGVDVGGFYSVGGQ